MPPVVDSFVALDFETSGLDPNRHGIIEAALVRYEGGRETAVWHSLIDPGIALHPESTLIHGLTSRDLKGAPRFAEVAKELLDFLGEGPPLAYYAAFDYGFLRAEAQRLELAVPPLNRWLDPLPLVRGRLGKGKASMENACRIYGVDPGEAHRALDDARAAARIWLLVNGSADGTCGGA